MVASDDGVCDIAGGQGDPAGMVIGSNGTAGVDPIAPAPTSFASEIDDVYC
mgnify:CR=1 FL=1